MVLTLLIPKYFNINSSEATAGFHQPQTDGNSEESCPHYANLAGGSPATTWNTDPSHLYTEGSQTRLKSCPDAHWSASLKARGGGKSHYNSSN